jgi:stage II sporulation protein D
MPSIPHLARAVVVAAAGVVAACGGGERIPLSSVTPPEIRVRLGDARDSVQFTVADAWEAVAADGGAWADRGSNTTAVVKAGPSGIDFRGQATGRTAVRVRPRGAFTIEVEGQRRAYRGDLIVRQERGRLVLVNELDLETYVMGVIVNEIGDGAAPAAYGAQGVVARTYGWSRARANPDAAWHVTDDQMSQVYRGLTLPKDAVVTVTDLEKRTLETRGVVLTWRGETFPTYYASTCGGHTTDAATSHLDPAGAETPLMGVPCSYCSSSKYYRWTEIVPIQRLVDGLKSRGVVAPIKRLEWTKVGRGGWVAEVTVTYGPRDAKKVVPGPAFRLAAGVRSMHLESVEAREDGSLAIAGSGWGHGVGMCQVGAQEMGRRGFAADQILRYYYPGAEFTRLY